MRLNLNHKKIGDFVSTEMAQYDEQTVKEYLEIVKRERMDWYWRLDEEKDCVAVLKMAKSVGVISNTEHVE